MSGDDAVVGSRSADGWNPGSRRAHRDQAARAGVLIALALGVL